MFRIVFTLEYLPNLLVFERSKPKHTCTKKKTTKKNEITNFNNYNNRKSVPFFKNPLIVILPIIVIH